MSPAAQTVHQKIKDLLDSDAVPTSECKDLLQEVANDCDRRLDCLRKEEAAG